MQDLKREIRITERNKNRFIGKAKLIENFVPKS